MKRILLIAACLLVIPSISISQDAKKDKPKKKPSKIWYKPITKETDVVKLEAKNIVSEKDITKFKFTIHNNTNDFVILKPKDCSMKSGSMEVIPNDKKRIDVRPLDSENKVIDATNTESNTMYDYNFSFNASGIYLAADGTAPEVPDFIIPATVNVIEEDDFRIDLISAYTQSNTQWRCKFKVTYTGKGVGIIEPRKITARLQQGGSMANNSGAKSFLLERGETENFLVYISTIQSMVIVWNDAFKSATLQKLDPLVMDFEWDPNIK